MFSRTRAEEQRVLQHQSNCSEDFTCTDRMSCLVDANAARLRSKKRGIVDQRGLACAVGPTSASTSPASLQ
jgi:hypothetical protein